MAYANSYKFKHNGKFRSAEEIAELRSAEHTEKEMPHINLDFLPSVAELEELEEDENIEYFFVCESKIPVVVDGVEVSKKVCGRQYSSEDPDTFCPYCNGQEARIIPRAFLKLFGTNNEVRHYVTIEMRPRKGLKPKYADLARQIIKKYGQTDRMNIKDIRAGQG